jgi:cysteine desulfurase family protein
MKSYYFDNAATSWPKPPSVMKAMKRHLVHVGGNPGRSGHFRAVEAGRVLLSARISLASLFGIRESERIVFTKNATEALNMVISGILHPGDHAVCTSMEHNAVMRPLTALKERGVQVSVVRADQQGRVDPAAVGRKITRSTKLVISTHASNVTGTILDISSIGGICREKGVSFLVDAAQTAGVLPIDVDRMCVDFLAFSGHKGLLGPQGTGGLYIGSDVLAEPLLRGGTGSRSESEIQPEFLPDRFESGTPNTVGIAGLCSGIEFLQGFELERVLEHDDRLLQILLNELSSERRLIAYGPGESGSQTGVLSITIEGISPSKIGETLEAEYGVQTRIGLHCAPSAHRTIGTFPDGTVRLSWGVFTREREVIHVARAVKRICAR